MGREDKKSGKRLAAQEQQKIRELLDEVLEKCTKLPSGDAKKEWKEFLEVHSLLEKVRDLEKPIVIDLPRRSGKWPAFLKWCSENGAFLGGVTVQDLPDGDCSLIAEEPIEESSQFLGVPAKLMMSLLSAGQSKLGPLLRDDPIMKGMPNVALALFLILELCSGQASFWHPYICILLFQ